MKPIVYYIVTLLKEISERKIKTLIAERGNPEQYLEELEKLVDHIVEDGVYYGGTPKPRSYDW